MNRILTIQQSIGIWICILLLSAAAMLGALYYQYYLDWEPCVLCIQIRVIMAGIMLVSALMLFFYRFALTRFAGYVLQSILAAVLFVKCRAIYRIEIGIDQAECMFNAGLPSWFNLEAWWPSVFEVRSACGDSPELFLGITMVEALYYSSGLALLLVLLLSFVSGYSLVKARH